MRIIHCIPSLQKGGAERLCLDIVRHLNKQPGVEARLVTLHATHDYADEYSDVKVWQLNDYVKPSVTGSWQVNYTQWEALLAEFKPDVIHSHLFEAEIFCRFKTLQNIRYFSHGHDNMHQLKKLTLNEITQKKRLTEAYERQWIVKKYLQIHNQFLAISRDTETYLKQQLPGKLTHNVHFFPNAIDVQQFKNEHLNEWQEPLELVNIGSFVPKKNQAFLVHIMAELKKRGIRAHLTCLGDGPLRKETQQMITQMGLTDEITLAGKQSFVAQYMHKAHAYIHSATYEPFGLVLLEAMAAGLPVISLNGKGNADLIEHGQNGYIFDHADPATFADCVMHLLQNPEHVARIRAQGYATAMRYDISNYVNQLTTLYTP